MRNQEVPHSIVGTTMVSILQVCPKPDNSFLRVLGPEVGPARVLDVVPRALGSGSFLTGQLGFA